MSKDGQESTGWIEVQSKKTQQKMKALSRQSSLVKILPRVEQVKSIKKEEITKSQKKRNYKATKRENSRVDLDSISDSKNNYSIGDLEKFEKVLLGSSLFIGFKWITRFKLGF